MLLAVLYIFFSKHTAIFWSSSKSSDTGIGKCLLKVPIPQKHTINAINNGVEFHEETINGKTLWLHGYCWWWRLIREGYFKNKLKPINSLKPIDLKKDKEKYIVTAFNPKPHRAVKKYCSSTNVKTQEEKKRKKKRFEICLHLIDDPLTRIVLQLAPPVTGRQGSGEGLPLGGPPAVPFHRRRSESSAAAEVTHRQNNQVDARDRTKWQERGSGVSAKNWEESFGKEDNCPL